MLKQFLLVVAGFIVGAAVAAAEVELRDDHPDTYTVQKGDTLWDISGKFLKKPWLWPEIWQANPQVKNPHWIYPGDQLSLVYVEGKPQLVSSGPSGNGRLSPHARAEPLDTAIAPVSLSEVGPFLTRARMLTEDEARHLPYVVALEENRLLGNQGQVAYVRGLHEHPGTKLVIVRPTVIYRDIPDHYPWEGVPRHVETQEWKADGSVSLGRWWSETVAVNHAYERKTEMLGYEVIEIGNAELLRGGDPATMLVRYSDVEIKRGDLVMAAVPMPFDLNFYPHPPKAEPDNMRVVAFTDGAPYANGTHQVVALSRGGRDGVENGQVYSLFQPGDVIRDKVMYGEDDLRTVFSDHKAEVQLPEEYVAHVMVFRTFDRISYGLVMDGVRPVILYDRAHAADYTADAD
jgi:hypothetical protein